MWDVWTFISHRVIIPRVNFWCRPSNAVFHVRPPISMSAFYLRKCWKTWFTKGAWIQTRLPCGVLFLLQLGEKRSSKVGIPLEIINLLHFKSLWAPKIHRDNRLGLLQLAIWTSFILSPTHLRWGLESNFRIPPFRW